MIKLTWNGENIELDEDEAQGFAEALDADGEVYSWERVVESTPETPATIDWIGETRERSTYRASSHAQEQAAMQVRHDAYLADLAAQAVETETPTWVIRCREQLAQARKYAKADAFKGTVNRRMDGSWFYKDQFGKSIELPSTAGDWFTDGQREP